MKYLTSLNIIQQSEELDDDMIKEMRQRNYDEFLDDPLGAKLKKRQNEEEMHEKEDQFNSGIQVLKHSHHPETLDDCLGCIS